MTKGLMLKRLAAIVVVFIMMFSLIGAIQSAAASYPPQDLASSPGRSPISLAANSAASPVQLQATTVYTFFFPNFTLVNSGTLNLVGFTRIYTPDSALRLTSASPCCQAGAAWYTTRQNVSDGFETVFDLRITDTVGGGADGLAFVIQNAANATNTVGNAGCGIGYAGIADSLAIEFDTFANPPYCETTQDPNGNHVSVQTRGVLPNSQEHAYSLGMFTPTADLSAGFHRVKINYTFDQAQLTGTLKIYVDNIDASSAPSLTVHVDLSRTLALSDGLAWVGFVAGTGTTLESHDILNWYFADSWDLTCLEYDFTLPYGGSHDFYAGPDFGDTASWVGERKGWGSGWNVGKAIVSRGIVNTAHPILLDTDGFPAYLLALINDPVNPHPIKQVSVEYTWTPASPHETEPLPASAVLTGFFELQAPSLSDRVRVDRSLLPTAPHNSNGWFTSRIDVPATVSVTHPTGLRIGLVSPNRGETIRIKKVGVCIDAGAQSRPPVILPGARQACQDLLANIKTRWQPYGTLNNMAVARQPEFQLPANVTLEPYPEFQLSQNVAGFTYSALPPDTALVACVFKQDSQLYTIPEVGPDGVPNTGDDIRRPIVRFAALGSDAKLRERLTLLNYAGYFSLNSNNWCYAGDNAFGSYGQNSSFPAQFTARYNVPSPKYRCDLEQAIDGQPGPCGSFVGSLYRAMGYFNVDALATAWGQSSYESAIRGLYYAVDAYEMYALPSNVTGPVAQPFVRVNNTLPLTYTSVPVTSFYGIRVYPYHDDHQHYTVMAGIDPLDCNTQELNCQQAITNTRNWDQPIEKLFSPRFAHPPAGLTPEQVWRMIEPGDIAITIIEHGEPGRNAGSTADQNTHIQVVTGWGPARYSPNVAAGVSFYPSYNAIPSGERDGYVPYVVDRYLLPNNTVVPRPFSFNMLHTATDFWIANYATRPPVSVAADVTRRQSPRSALLLQPTTPLSSTGNPLPPVVPSSVEWSPTGNRIALGGSFGIVLYSANLQNVIPLTGATSAVIDLAWSPDGMRLASAESAQRVAIWEVATGRRVGDLAGHLAELTSVAWSPSGNRLATSSKDGRVQVWNAGTYALSATLAYTGDSYVNVLAWSPSGDRLAGGDSTTLFIWDAATGGLLTSLPVQQTPNRSLSWTPDGQYLVIPGPHIWNITTGQEIAGLSTCSDGTDTVSALSSPTGFQLASAGASQSGVSACITTLNSQKHEIAQNAIKASQRTEAISALAWSPDNQKVIFATQSGWLNLWNAGTGDLLAVATRPTVITAELESMVQRCVSDDALELSLTRKLTGGDYAGFITEVQAQASQKIPADCANQLMKTAEFLISHPLPPPVSPSTPQPLTLTGLCSSEPANHRTWAVYNPNPYEVLVYWGWAEEAPALNGAPFVVPAANGNVPGVWLLNASTPASLGTLKIMSGDFAATAPSNETACRLTWLPLIRKGN